MSERAYVRGTLESYLDKLASGEPEPGGGSVSALVGALGAALVTMVTNLTLGKEKYAEVQDDMVEIQAESERLRRRLEELVTLDAVAYGKVATAMKLPRDDENQKEARRRVLQTALRGAAEVPLEVAETALAVAKLSLPTVEKGNINGVSDGGVAVLLADVAAQAAALNVKTNLAWIEDEAFGRDAWTRVEAVLSETARLRDIVMAITYSKI